MQIFGCVSWMRFNGVYGAHDGQPGIHAKGTLCSGTFTATSDAAW
jgi:hypothetical protein